MRDIIKDQVIEINFVKSAENDSDIMTKNQQGQHYMYAKSELVYTVQEMNEKRDTEDEATGRMLERERDLAMCSPSSNGSKMISVWTNQKKS